jgi:DNA-binding transcriptional regulator YdaS (Cro superfamily)
MTEVAQASPESMKSALGRAIAIVGIGRLSEALGISRAAIYQWERVPAERVLAVEAAVERARADKVTREQLRPDIYPPQSLTAA